MKTSLRQKLLTIIAAFSMTVPPLAAQVTIGAGLEPNVGAVLDLKQENRADGSANSLKGLGLPRVNLTNLKPTLSTGATNSLPVSIGAASTENWSLSAHTGLTVYNVKEDQCAGILGGVYTWSGTEWMYLGRIPEEVLAQGVEYHDPKPGVYEGFWSAEFGSAGRWMTTNLAAWKYDGIQHSTDLSGTATSGSGTLRTLEGPNANSNNLYNTAYWCYPNGGSGGSTSTTYDANPQLGLLYTWDAATAGKGGANGQQNTANEQNMDESNQPRIQGICPSGWHLPSDKEWNELEKYIYEHAEDFSSYTPAQQDAFPNSGTWDPIWNTAPDYRPTGSPAEAHGKAMKSPCPIPPSTTATNGLSNTSKSSGFSGLLAGYAFGGSTISFGNNALFWSSSSSGSRDAWYRYLYSNDSGVYRVANYRYYLFSVRCKKDN
jgi:uncharacterized protein (TIGR02145 family)